VNIQIDNTGPFAVAQVTGECDVQEAERLTETLREFVSGDGAALAIDLSKLMSIDSSGLSALIDLVTRARLSRGRVVLVSPSPFISGIFDVTRLDTWFDICDSLDEARKRLASA
jgi:anti-anti-sigma factor